MQIDSPARRIIHHSKGSAMTIVSERKVIGAIADFCDRFLGKGIVHAKDTPNFIANRIGTFSMVEAMREMLASGYTPEEIDAITGPAIGRPKSASFRTVDIAGLDVLAQDRKSTRLNSSHVALSRMPSSA